MKHYILRIGEEHLDDAEIHPTLTAAKNAYRRIAPTARLGATIHVVHEEDQVDGWPDYEVSTGPRGGGKWAKLNKEKDDVR